MLNFLGKKRKKYLHNIHRINMLNLHPTSMMRTEHIFSLFVFGLTLPNPTDVKDENVKYKAVTYLTIHKLFSLSNITDRSIFL